MSTGCGCGCGCQVELPCGCCEGVEVSTPQAVANRPGLDALRWRVGTHGSFLETMLARLAFVQVDKDERPLARLTERSTEDTSIALLDAWASVAAVLTFYTERIANEGYLRTATERRSVLELARLIGYELRPGVAATTYLAFTLEDGFEVNIPAGTRAQSVPRPGELAEPYETDDPLSARWLWNALRPRLSVPVKLSVGDVSVLWLAGIATGLSAGSLLLLEDLTVEPTRVGLVRVTEVRPDRATERTRVTVASVLTESGVSQTATPRVVRQPPAPDPGELRRQLARDIREELNPAQFRVSSSGQTARQVLGQLRALLRELTAEPAATELAKALDEDYLPVIRAKLAHAQGAAFVNVRAWLEAVIARLEGTQRAFDEVRSPISALDLKNDLLVPPSLPPPSRLKLERTLEQQFIAGGDLPLRVLGELQPALAATLLPAWQTTSTPADVQQVLALRDRANLFGFNAQLQVDYDPATGNVLPPSEWKEWDLAQDERAATMYLDGIYPSVTQGSRIVVHRPPAVPVPVAAATAAEAAASLPAVFEVRDVQVRPRTAYNISDTVTALELDRGWWHPPPATTPDTMDVIRGTVVHLGAEPLDLAERPLSATFPDESVEDKVPLDGLYGDLEPGRWLVVFGERLLDPQDGQLGAATVPASELVMIAGVEHGLAANGELPGDTPHTTLTLASPLAYHYQRDSVVIAANVAKSSHGETVDEVLGSGDASTPLQRFELQRSPLTHVAAATPTGVRSTLQVRVNGVEWEQAIGLLDLERDERAFLSRAEDDLVTEVVFGDGKHGSRLPTGLDNVEARYRFRIGLPGNVDAGRISLLATIPRASAQSSTHCRRPAGPTLSPATRRAVTPH